MIATKTNGALQKIGKSYKKYPQELEKLTALFTNDIGNRRHGEDKMKPLSPNTIKNYVGKLDRLAAIVTGEGYNGSITWIENTDKVRRALEATKLSGLKDYITPIVKMLKAKNARNDIIESYQTMMAEFKQNEYKVRGENRASEKSVNASLSLPTILERIEKYEPQDDMQLIYKMLCSMYFQNSFVPRLTDITLMKLVSTSKKPSQMDLKYNYITTDKNGEVKQIIMNQYKTKSTYGQQKFDITPPVKKLMNDYLAAYNKRNGDYFILNSEGQPFLRQNFSELLGDATEKVLGSRMGADLIRQIIITDYYTTNAHSINEDQEFARRFLHSSQVQKEYLRLNLKTTEDDS